MTTSINEEQPFNSTGSNYSSANLPSMSKDKYMTTYENFLQWKKCCGPGVECILLDKTADNQTTPHIVFVILWGFVLYLTLHVPLIEMRTNEDDTVQKYDEQPQVSTVKPEPLIEIQEGKCFHLDRSMCPTNGSACKKVDPVSVFCCDVANSSQLKEGLQIFMNQNTTHLHVLNASFAELNVSTAMYRRLTHMSLTDGNITRIVGQFPKYSSIACLNISNNNLSSAKLDPSNQRPFAYLFNLTTLDASSNNLTEFPLSLVQSNRKISVDFSGNNYLPCKHFQMVMDANNSSLVTFTNYDNTYCAKKTDWNWFKEVQIINIEYIKKQKELNISCSLIQPPNMNCTCVPDRMEMTLVKPQPVSRVAVDCSQRHLKEMPTNLPPNTLKLNVSYNNITSLQAVADDPTYEHLRQLIVDYNDIQSIVELEGTKFIDNFMLFSISHNKLKTIHAYVLSNQFDKNDASYTSFLVSGNYIHCDCNTEKFLKPWLQENFKVINDYKDLQCEDNLGPVVDLVEGKVCHTPRDWTDYIYYIIGLEVLVLITLVGKVSYDYWVFKTAGYLPWPANKMPRLPCDWLCE